MKLSLRELQIIATALEQRLQTINMALAKAPNERVQKMYVSLFSEVGDLARRIEGAKNTAVPE